MTSAETVIATGSLRVVAQCVWYQECTELLVSVPSTAYSVERQGHSQVAFTIDLPRGPATVVVRVVWRSGGLKGPLEESGSFVVKVPP